MAWIYDQDAAWESFGKTDPYFAVVTHDAYRADRLDEDSRSRFFLTGEAHVTWLLNALSRSLNRNFIPALVLDYGCGVGRCLVPFARISRQVVGVDVSPAMLKEATQNCGHYGIKNVRLLSDEDWPARLDDDFDLVHSFIVLQHIAPTRGEEIARSLLAKVRVGGTAALHFTFRLTTRTRLVSSIRRYVPLGCAALNVCTSKPIRYPAMISTTYNLNSVATLFYEAGFPKVELYFTNHGGNIGAMILSQKCETVPRRM